MSSIQIKLQIYLQSELQPDEMLQKFQDAMNALCFNLEQELPAKDRFINYKLGDTLSEL